MRYLLLAWLIIIAVFSFTKDVLKGIINFGFNFNPSWDNLFISYSLQDINLVEFLGRLFMYFILTSLLVSVFKRIFPSVIMSFLYGLVIELL